MNDLSFERAAIALFEQLLDLPEAERDAWVTHKTEGRSELATRIAAMRDADRRAQLWTGAAADSLGMEEAPERIGAYRITNLIGRGGMGSVYRGERATGDFDRVVAIKIVKPGLLSERLVERFRRERQLLAGLSHPHIARLYDGGETETGSPYIVMELIDGLTLLDWLDERGPSQAARLRLFADICDAVAFAHRNLIVHRDLTPSNVLVTPDGHAKLIDFGIARPADAKGISAPSAGTGDKATASLSLTPGYAAPERLLSGEVTTAADIYSLGRLLSRIEPAKDDRELKAIVARATASDPLDRYPTAEALSADVAAWSGGLPVSAIEGGRGYAFSKFARRHRLGVAIGALVTLLVVGALVLTLFANVRAARALADAERRFGETRAIAKTLLFEAFDEVSRVPGSTAAREQLARTGLAYLEALAADESAPLDVRIEAGRGYLRLAQVVGGGLSSQLGRYEDANALLARADEILAPIVRDHPDNAAARQALAALRIEQSAVNLYNNNRVDVARAQAQEARTLVGPDPAASVEAARLNADAIRAEGDTWLWGEDYQRARTLFLDGERFIAGIPEAMQRDPLMQGIRAGNLRYLGEAHHKLDETEPARRALDQAVELQQAVLSTQPNDPLFRRRVVTTLRYRAIVHRANDRNELARASIQQARAGAIQLRDRDPSDVGSLQLFAVVSEVHMQTLSDLGRHAEAYAIADEIRAAYRTMVDRAGNAPGQLRSMAMALRSEAEARYNGGDHSGACRTWDEVATILDGLERRGVLTETDRNNAQTQTRDYLRRACGPPHAGLGPRL